MTCTTVILSVLIVIVIVLSLANHWTTITLIANVKESIKR